MATNQPGALDAATDLFTVTNRASTTLDGGITDVATTIVVTDGSVFPAAGRFMVTIEDERVIIASRVTVTLTVESRGADNSSNVAHSDDATIAMQMTALHYETLRDAVIGTQEGYMQRPTTHDAAPSGIRSYGRCPLENVRRFAL